ncbi:MULTISPECIES: response regulator transcription factor [unclassified Phenylobacterium]|uniref:LuxR C-terminal-related transcriptional regulator n=1 Tax=unclassified Phenylobacterium TaxID=2640670 RepID=UPI00083AB56F|nr:MULTISPECIES: response regulator transcription factor [unclassified Phenylobacterium]
MTTVVVADDHPLMLDAVAGLFRPPAFAVLARCQDGLQARHAIQEHAPDLAVLDVHMPRVTGLELLAQARAEGWPTKILLLTAGLEPEPIVEAIRLKVDGLILKGAGADILVRAAEAVASGSQWIDKEAMAQVIGILAEPPKAEPIALTPRETDVVRHVAQGRRNKEIARNLGISEGTVKMHLHNIYEKLAVSSRTELAILARERKLG